MDQVHNMEHDIARTTDYDLLAPTAHDLWIGNPKAIDLAEQSLPEYGLLSHPPTKVAEACARLAARADVHTDLEMLIIIK